MVRIPDWESMLHAAITDREFSEFEWGHHDCLQFALFVYKEISGIDLREELELPEYHSKHQAVKILQDRYNGDLLELVDSFAERVKPIKLQRGNLVATETSEGPAIGIWVSPVARFASRTGLASVSRRDLICAWET